MSTNTPLVDGSINRWDHDCFRCGSQAPADIFWSSTPRTCACTRTTACGVAFRNDVSVKLFRGAIYWHA
eukprot:3619629-Pyramimonas_sp.AAC.1